MQRRFLREPLTWYISLVPCSVCFWYYRAWKERCISAPKVVQVVQFLPDRNSDPVRPPRGRLVGNRHARANLPTFACMLGGRKDTGRCWHGWPSHLETPLLQEGKLLQERRRNKKGRLYI